MLDNGKHPKVVVTVPLGVLKTGGITFIPPLPEDKQNALNDVTSNDLGSFSKIWMLFDQPFWDPVSVWIVRVPDNDDVNGKRMVLFVNFLNILGPPILLAMNNGDYAAALDAMSPEAATMEAVSTLQSMFPSESSTGRINLIDSKVSNWTNDPFSRMAYSCYDSGVSSPPPLSGAGGDEGDVEMMMMMVVIARSVDDRIFFTGDGTNMVGGALWCSESV
jgi:monoamine oxidase